MSTLPESQNAEAFSLTPDPLVELFLMELVVNGEPLELRFKAGTQATWQEQTWNGYYCTLAGAGLNSNGEWNRPKFSIANEDGLFSTWVFDGELDNALVTRYRVLKSDLEADLNAFTQSIWRVSKVLSLSSTLITLELRTALDGQNFKLPGRRFYPPEFPFVSL